MRWRLERYLKRQGTYKLVGVIVASTYAAALTAARDRFPRVVELGRWRLYVAKRYKAVAGC